MGAGEAFCSARGGVDGGVQDTEVRLGLGTIIEPEDSLYRAGQLGWQMNAAFTNSIGGALQNLLREGDAKGLLHSADSSGELNGTALGFWCAFFHCQPELFRESAHQCNRGRIGGVLLAILRAREPVLAQAFGIERSLAPDDDRNREDAAGTRRLFAGGRGQGSLFTTGQYYALLGREAGGGCFGSHGEFSEVRTHDMPVYVSKEVTSGIQGLYPLYDVAPGFPVRSSGQVCVCGFLHGKPHEAR